MCDKLINYWREVDKQKYGTYCHPKDNALINTINVNTKFNNYNDFISDTAFPEFDVHSHHLNLIPAPYLGDIRNAEIFILMLNPGFGFSSYYEIDQLDLNSVMINNLKQENLGEYPLWFLKPQFLWTDGGSYWLTKFKGCMDQVATKQGKTAAEMLKVFSQKIAIVEYFPYCSASFKKPPKEFPSSKMVVEFVQRTLVPKATNNEICIIATRQSTKWDLPQHRNIIIYEGKQCQSASLSPQSPGGGKLIEFIMKP